MGLADNFEEGTEAHDLAKKVQEECDRILQRGFPASSDMFTDIKPTVRAVTNPPFDTIGICDVCEGWFPVYTEHEATCPTVGCKGEVLCLKVIPRSTAKDKEAWYKRVREEYDREDQLLKYGMPFGDLVDRARYYGITQWSEESSEDFAVRCARTVQEMQAQQYDLRDSLAMGLNINPDYLRDSS